MVVVRSGGVDLGCNVDLAMGRRDMVSGVGRSVSGILGLCRTMNDAAGVHK